MANCLEITLWYPEDKFNALSTALEPAGSSVEEELGRVLTELYERLVPSEQRVEIAEKLAREEQHEAEERVRHEAETYRVSVLKLTAGRACEYHKLTRAWDLLALAAFIRETVRKSPSSPSGDFRSRLGETERLSTQDFERCLPGRFSLRKVFLCHARRGLAELCAQRHLRRYLQSGAEKRPVQAGKASPILRRSDRQAVFHLGG